MRVSRIFRLGIVAWAALTCAPALATPISARVQLQAQVNLDGSIGSHPQSASWGTLLDPLNISSNALVDLSADDGGAINAQGSIDALWGAGGYSGSVTFTNYGWATSPSGTLYEANLNSLLPDYTYTFQADADGTFFLSYNVTATGSKFGLQGWVIDWSGPDGGVWPDPSKVFDPTTSGTMSRVLIAGTIYTLTLSNNSNISGSGFDAGSMGGLFEFSISETSPSIAVSESPTLPLFLAGVAAVLGLRRRKKCDS